MNEITVELVPWLSQQIEPGSSGRLLLRQAFHEGETVRDLLERMARARPEFARHVVDLEAGNLRQHVAAILNDRIIELLGGLDEPLRSGDTLTLIPTYQGGAGVASPGMEKEARVASKWRPSMAKGA